MPKSSPSLIDKFDLEETHQLLTGSQAIVRLMLMQHARDRARRTEHRRLCHRLSRLADRRPGRRLPARAIC